MKKHLILLSLLISFHLLSNATRGGSGGSGYSRYGIGDIRFFGGSRSAGMGGTTIALLSPYSLNRFNPAGQAKLLRTHFEGTFSYEGFKTSDGLESAYLSTGSFGGAFFAVPLSVEQGLTLSMGFNPYSTVNYKIQSQSILGTNNYSQLYFGEGGLSTAIVGLSVAPAESLSVGLRLNYLFGQTRTGSDVTFASSEFVSTRYRRTTNMNGFGLTLGLIYTGLGQLIRVPSLNGVEVGAVFSTATNLNATQENLNITSIGEDSLANRDGKVHIPISAGVGVSWLLGEKYLIAGDIFHQQWSDLTSYDVHPSQIRNSTRVSLGMELQPSRVAGASYGSRMAYRFGAYYLSSYYQIGSESINEMALTTGLGLPIGGDTRLDLSLEYGTRGTTNQHLLKDNIIRFSATLNVGERWFVRTEEE